jgi:hypothetical protein
MGYFFYPSISAFFEENPIVKDYLWLIPFTGLCMAYFEIFYAWASEYAFCFGNFIKEVGLRFFSLLALVAVYYNWITVIQFVYVTGDLF